MEKVVIGLSDGVDSAVAASLLKASGYMVHGLYLYTGDDESRRGAERSAEELDITLKTIDITDKLKKLVCEPFIREYMNGQTPSPCIRCNPELKFKSLSDYANMIGAEKIATGHYAKCNGSDLFMGDPSCDQSYMLCRLSERVISHLLLPLGDFKKDDIRQKAAKIGLHTANKADSRENCFIKKGMSYSEWISLNAEMPPKGPVYFHNNYFGEHKGICFYTVGQRWEEMSDGRRLYIDKISSNDNRIDLCLWEESFKTDILIDEMSWIHQPASATFSAYVRARHTRWETPQCTVTPISDHVLLIHAHSPLRAPAPGQAAALYDRNKLIGGGFIRKVM